MEIISKVCDKKTGSVQGRTKPNKDQSGHDTPTAFSFVVVIHLSVKGLISNGLLSVTIYNSNYYAGYLY